jgi:hypothetical protein
MLNNIIKGILAKDTSRKKLLKNIAKHENM